MPAPRPTIYLIAGCNGAGKTTFAKEFLPREVKCLRLAEHSSERTAIMDEALYRQIMTSDKHQ
jgi:predicted ABC-type ATPase